MARTRNKNRSRVHGNPDYLRTGRLLRARLEEDVYEGDPYGEEAYTTTRRIPVTAPRRAAHRAAARNGHAE